MNAAGVTQVTLPREAERSDIEILLATATRAEGVRPTPHQMADARVAEGGEDYFFRNVENEIRTPDDLAIWARLVERQAACLGRQEYARAFETLREEAAGVAG